MSYKIFCVKKVFDWQVQAIFQTERDEVSNICARHLYIDHHLLPRMTIEQSLTLEILQAPYASSNPQSQYKPTILHVHHPQAKSKKMVLL